MNTLLHYLKVTVWQMKELNAYLRRSLTTFCPNFFLWTHAGKMERSTSQQQFPIFSTELSRMKEASNCYRDWRGRFTLRLFHAKSSDWYLITNFALFNLHHNNTPVWVWKLITEGFTNLLRPITLLWVNFQGHDERLKITKIRFLKILNYAHFFNRQIRHPVKHRNT